MSDLDFSALTHQMVTTAGIMHHQTKLDIFIIRAYKLLSSGSIINTNTLHSVTNSPQTSTNTPAGTANAASTNSAGTGGSTGIAAANGNGSINGTANGSQGIGSSNANVNISNGGCNTLNTNSTNPIQLQYTQLFGKISKLYNATISSGSIDDRSTSPKSAIELYQRFQQIIKELELSYEVSPYSRYFKRLDQGLWQIKDDSELKNDRLWEHVSMFIFSIYDPRTGQMINQGRKKANSLAASTKGSPSENGNGNGSSSNNSNNNTNNNNNNNNSSNNNNTGNGTNKRQQHQRASNSAGNPIVNPTMNNMMMDVSLPQQLQRRLQTISQDVNSRSLNGYYAQPTSPGQGGFGFGLDNDTTLYKPNGNNSTFNNNTSNSWKRRSLGSLGEDALDDDTVEELLQLTNTAKRQKTATPINFNNVNGNNLNTMNTDSSQTMNTTMNPQAVMNNVDSMNRNSTLSSFANSNTANNGMMINDTLNSNGQNLNMNANNNNTVTNADLMVKHIKGSYDTLITEKNQRINHLERELEMQRQESQWLRKMLIEDMGCIRSLLKDLRR